MLKNCLFPVLLAQLAATTATAADVPPAGTPCNFLPWPQSLKVEAPGELVLTASSGVVTTVPSLAPLVKVLAAEIRMLTGIKPVAAMGAGKAGDIVVAIDPALKNEAAYTLTNKILPLHPHRLR